MVYRSFSKNHSFRPKITSNDTLKYEFRYFYILLDFGHLQTNKLVKIHNNGCQNIKKDQINAF